MNKLFNELEINAGLKYSGIEANANVSKISPKWVIVIGSLLVAYGLYRYYHQKKEVNC